MSNTQLTDVTIIGAGPVGLYAATLCHAKKLSVQIFESLEEVGGQLTTLYPEKNIYNIPGFLAIKSKDFIHNQKEQIASMEIPVHLEEKVINLQKNEDHTFQITTTKGEYRTKTVLVAVGTGSFIPNKLGVAGEEIAEQNHQLHYFVTNKEAFTNKRVAIFGGGDSAVDIALMLQTVAKEVHLIHRRNEFRANEGSLHQLDAGCVNVHTPFGAESLEITEGRLTGLTLASKQGEETRTIDVDEMIVNFGFKPAIGEIGESILNFDKRHKLAVTHEMDTDIPGVYAIGDVVTYEEKINNLAVGFGEAHYAVKSLAKYLKETAKV